MKSEKFKSKLTLKKETVSSLDFQAMANAKGGEIVTGGAGCTWVYTACGSCPSCYPC